MGCDSSGHNLLIGAVLAIVGNLMISASFQVQKFAHNKNEGQVAYTKIPMWWLGLLFMAGGEVGNFMAYGYAPATLVAPLGAVSVIANAMLARFILGELLMVNNIIGVLLALIGAVAIVVSAPTSCGDITIATLKAHMRTDQFLIFLALVVLGILAIVWKVPEHLKHRYVIFYVAVCGLMGSITVMSSKGVSTALRLLFQGDPAWFQDWLVYLLIVGAAGSIVIQMRYLNQAMITFGTTEVVPVYYVCFNLCSITAGMVLYHEYTFGEDWKVAVFVLGVLVTCIGVFLINMKQQKGNKPGLHQSLIDEEADYEGTPEPKSTNLRASDTQPHDLRVASDDGRASLTGETPQP
mmetsp:Transcript_13539/g.31161  ORF Transcript_13539/g.31161 Transcript_13539/m.31161 type:complete len:351 (-) Transcript_13539:791-1843(-)|eukprot:CAMPEP_0114539318 /NCGR_PEP_ID=MMETSP0114-20121206/174_1 /TAXON_ID=31324 /ORGANISM="Goniomonas sp, Strain m" /LENGTH=350 /DNA_ID=CAMNT_0001723413 /DNA_START=25 /DNA_END=1077 /DNA_ORIENTATION=-